MALFNLRVYGILINARQEVLISDEFEHHTQFTKFPGGGMEEGESTTEALKREFKEECQMEIQVLSHFYTTDFFVKSIFSDAQIVSIYYLVAAPDPIVLDIKTRAYDFDGQSPVMQAFRWVPMAQLRPEEMTFETEKKVVDLLQHQYSPPTS